MKGCTKKCLGFMAIIGILYLWYKSYCLCEEDEETCDYYQPLPVSDTLLDINSATVEDLQKVNGVGESLAEKIVEYRNENGPFQSKDDIRKVKGVGEHNFPTIYDQIMVR